MKLPKEFYLVWSKIEDKKKVYRGIAITLIVSAIGATVPYIYGRLVDLAIKPHSSANVLVLIILAWTIRLFATDWID